MKVIGGESVGLRSDSGVGDHALVVHGGHRLFGTVRASGFKHSLVTIVAAAASSRACVRVTNCPDIVETRMLSELLAALGGIAVQVGDTLTVNASQLTQAELDPVAASRIHGAVYLVPALLSKVGRARVPTDGGCHIGSAPGGRRPVQHYVSVLERFGARARVLQAGDLEVSAPRLSGCEIDLLDYASGREIKTGPLYSGATKMALLTAAVADGVSTLHNLYPKPDVTDLVTVLRQLGADIESPAPGTVRVHGRGAEALCNDVAHTLIPDLIEVVTWICAGATLADGLRITAADMTRAAAALAPELDVLDRMGVRMDLEPAELTVHAGDRLTPCDITVASHGVYSDSQPFLALLATHASGPTRITETVWGERFGYLPGLAALGARMRRRNNVLRVNGPCPPRRAGQRLFATDLRAAAVLLLAALAAPGPTVIDGTHHLARGYPDLPGALRSLGAEITVASQG